jgi:hypothetical protein
MMCSQPISSPVSSKMQEAPSAMSWSKARPAAGLPVMPEVPSEPPQTVPITSSLTCIGTVSAASSAMRCSSTQARPSLIEARVPPVPWITIVFTGRPVARTTRSSAYLLKLSQPSETRSTAPTLGWVQSCSIIRSAYGFG